MLENRPKDRIRHSEHGENWNQELLFARKFESHSYKRMHFISFRGNFREAFRRGSNYVCMRRNLNVSVKKGSSQVCLRWNLYVTFFEMVIMYVGGVIWKIYLKDMFTEFVFKRIRNMRLEMTAIMFVCGHFKRLPLFSIPQF